MINLRRIKVRGMHLTLRARRLRCLEPLGSILSSIGSCLLRSVQTVRLGRPVGKSFAFFSSHVFNSRTFNFGIVENSWTYMRHGIAQCSHFGTAHSCPTPLSGGTECPIDMAPSAVRHPSSQLYQPEHITRPQCSSTRQLSSPAKSFTKLQHRKMYLRVWRIQPRV